MPNIKYEIIQEYFKQHDELKTSCDIATLTINPTYLVRLLDENFSLLFITPKKVFSFNEIEEINFGFFKAKIVIDDTIGIFKLKVHE